MSFKAYVLAGAFFALGITAGAYALPSESSFRDPRLPLCGETYHSDSFGRGIESVFRGGDLRPRPDEDETCYQLGVQQGRSVRAESDGDCDGDFAAGRAQGLEDSDESAGSACFVAGYQAGRADLDIAAREGEASIAGQDCVAAYLQGRGDFRASRANDPSDLDDAKSQYCYGLGYFEGSL